MKKEILVLGSLILFVGLIVSVSAIPPEPMAFYGNVNYANGTAIPNGYYLVAKINGNINGECEIIGGVYGKGQNTCIVVTHSTDSKVEFYIGTTKLGEYNFQAKEIIKLDFTIDVLPPRNLSKVSNGICEVLKGECSYNLLDCDNSITKVCVGNGVCDSNIGETCSNAPSDCGVCVYCGDGSCNNGETCSSCSGDCGTCSVTTPTSGGGGGGSSKKTTPADTSSNNNDLLELSVNVDEGNNEETTTQTNDKSSRKGITGDVISDFVKTSLGKGLIILIIIVLIVLIYFGIKKHK